MSDSNRQMTCQASTSATVADDFAGTKGGIIRGLRPICN